MRKLTLLVSIVSAALGLLALSAVASAAHRTGTTCDYAAGQGPVNSTNVHPGSAGGAELYVYAGTSGGMSGSADAVAGACLNEDTAASDFEGGVLEAGVGQPLAVGPGAGGPTGVYLIADGDNDNDDPGPGPPHTTEGYIGVSNFETGTKEDSCTIAGGDASTGTNSGDCLTIRMGGNIAAFPVPLLACGNTSGNMWDHAGRDGCTVI